MLWNPQMELKKVSSTLSVFQRSVYVTSKIFCQIRKYQSICKSENKFRIAKT